MFLKGKWDGPTFVFSYFSVAFFPALFFGWKLIKKTHWKKPHEVDLKGEVEEIEEYTRNFRPEPSKNAFDRWFNVIFGGKTLLTLKKTWVMTDSTVGIDYDKDLKQMRARNSVSYDVHGKI